MFTSTQQASAYLAAMIDGEGCVTDHVKDKLVSIANTDYGLLEASRIACEMLAIPCSIREQGALPSGKPFWNLHIRSHADFVKVRNYVPLQSQRKWNQLGSLIAHTRTLPKPTRDELYALYWEHGYSLSDLMQTYQMSMGYVFKLMEEHGIPRRSASDSVRLGKRKNKPVILDRTPMPDVVETMLEIGRDQQSITGYLAGIIDGEGSVSLDAKNRYIKVTNTDYDIITTVQRFFQAVGIACPIYEKAIPADKEWSRCWIAQVYSRKGFEFIGTHVPLQSQRKRDLIETARQSFVYRPRQE